MTYIFNGKDIIQRERVPYHPNARGFKLQDTKYKLMNNLGQDISETMLEGMEDKEVTEGVHFKFSLFFNEIKVANPINK